MARRITGRRALLDRWRGIEELEADASLPSNPTKQHRILQKKEEWFSDAFNFLISLSKEIHIWCGNWDLMGPLLETFYNYFKDSRPDSPLKTLWARISQELRQCTQCISQHHQAQEAYVAEYESDTVGPLLSVLRSMDEERVTEHLKEINARINGKEYDSESHDIEIVSVMFEVLTFPILFDDHCLVNEFQCFIEAVDGSHELALSGHQQYLGVYALLFLKSGRARSIGLRLAGCMGKLRRAKDLEPLQPLLKKCICLLETEVLPSSCDTSRPRVQLERLTVWLGIKSLLGYLEPPAFEEGILERYPIFLSIVLNHVSDDTLEFTYAINCLRLLFEMLGYKLWLKTTFSPSVMRNTLLGQCFHTRNEKSHKEIFDIFQPFLQSLEALQDGEHEKQRRHFLYFLLHQVTQSSNFSFLMRKKARQIALLIIHRGYTMNPPCPPFECAHIWGPSLVCSLKDSSLHSSLRQPSFDLIHTIIVSDASALVSLMLKPHASLYVDMSISADFNDEEDELPFFHDVEEKESSCWSEFSEQSKLTSRECKDWMCIPMLWVDVLIGMDPSALPISFSKAVFWALSRFSMVESEASKEMELSVRDWLSSYAGQISFLFGWKVPSGSDDGGNKESKNSVKASTLCVPLVRAFKRCAAHFVVQMEQGELRKQWTWEPRMAESLILLLIEPNDNVRQAGRVILEYVSKTRGLASGLQFLCSTASSLSGIYLGLRYALKLVLLDSVVSSFHNLHHLFFVVRKLLKEVAESSQKPPMNSTDDSNVQKFSSEGGFLRQPVFEISPGSSSGHLNIVDPESWDNFCCLVANSLWPSMLKCLVEGKAFIDSKISQMTCVRLLEMFPVVFERLNSKALKLSGTSDTSMPHFYDFKWLNDLVDWGKSSLVVLSRHWKQCVLSLLNILQVSCHVNSARIIMDIETLISCDIVSIDDVKDQVLRLSISLSRKSSFTSEMKAVKKEPSSFEDLLFERKCSVEEPSSVVDEDVDILVPAENLTESTVIVVSDDEPDKLVGADVVTSGKGLSQRIDFEDFAPASGKTGLQNAEQRNSFHVSSSKDLLGEFPLKEVDGHSGGSSQEQGNNASRDDSPSSECLSSGRIAASHVPSKVVAEKEGERGYIPGVTNNCLSQGIATSAGKNSSGQTVEHLEVKDNGKEEFICDPYPRECALRNPLTKPGLTVPTQQVVDVKKQEEKVISSLHDISAPPDISDSAQASLSGQCVDYKNADHACFEGTNSSDAHLESRDTIIKELVRDSEGDPSERAVKLAKSRQSISTNLAVSVPKRKVIQLKVPVENKSGHLQRFGAAVKRFKPPRLDDWYRPILEIDYFSTVGLSSADKVENTTVSNTSLKEVPLCFTSPDQYIEIFRPLILEEFKAQLLNSHVEMPLTEMCCGSLCVLSVERIDDFHIIRCIPDDSEASSSKGCLENDLVLLTKSPMQNPSQNIHVVGKVERRDKNNKSRSYILVIRFYLESGSLRSNKVKRLLTERSKWYVSRIMSITPQLREFQALSSLKDNPMLPIILNPVDRARTYPEPRNADLSMLSLPQQQVLKSSFNDSQLQAIGVAIGTRDSKKSFELSLIQGPPGTGKTRTIVAIVSGLLALGTTQKNDAAMRQHNNPRPSSSSSFNPKPKISQSTAIARAWQDAAFARQLEKENGKSFPGPIESSVRGRVLICAQSNAAVDELVSRISNEGLYGSDGKMYKPYLVRVGNAKTVHSSSLPFFIDTLVDQRLAEEKSQGDVKNDTSMTSSMVLRSKLERLVDSIRSFETKRANLRDNDSCVKNCLEEGVRKEDDQLEISDTEIEAKLKVLYGQKKSICADLAAAQAREKKDSEEVKAHKHKLRKAILREAEVVVTTLSGCGGDIYGVCYEPISNPRFGNSSEHFLFDAVIIDEAAQALEPATLIPLQLLKSNGTKCVMVGDPKQLPATVLSNIASKFLFECSMFERLQRAGHPVIMLTEQVRFDHVFDLQMRLQMFLENQVVDKYRMHPEICRFPSLHFYGNKLLNSNTMDMKSKKFHENPYLGPYVFFDVLDGRENRGKNSGALSLYNEPEADAAVEVLRFFKKRYPSEFIGGRVGIITPYRSQVSLLRSRFSNVFGSDAIADMEFNTIDGFQGREVDILILSTVRASDQSAEEPGFNSSSIGFVADVRRMNVALTRAKLSLWIVGNARTLQANFNWAALLKDAKERNLVISVARPYESIFRKPLSPSRRSHNLVSSKSHLRNLKHAKGINCTNQGVKETGGISKKSHERRNGHLDRVVERRTSRHRPDCDVIRTNSKHRTSSNTVGAVKRMDDKPSKDLKLTKIVKPVVGDSKDQGQEIGQRSNLVGAPHTGKEREKLDRSRCSRSIVQPKKDTGAGIRVLKVSKEVEESSKHGKLGDLSQKKVVSLSSTEGCHQEKGAKNHGNAFSQDGKSEDIFATRKRQRDAVDALLSSALISSKKRETSSRSAPVRRQLPPTAAARGANKPSNPSKAQPIASTRQRGATLSPHRHSCHPRNTRDHSSSGRDLDEAWKYFKDIIRESKER